MKPKITALLIHHRNDRFYTLQVVLEALSIKVIRLPCVTRQISLFSYGGDASQRFCKESSSL